MPLLGGFSGADVLYTLGRPTYSGAAMNSQEAGSSTYRSLAQQRAVVSCQLEPQSLPRFAQACGVLDTVSADLTFSLDDQGRVMVKGRVVAEAELGCHRCEEMVPKRVDAMLTALVAFSEEQADAWDSVTPETDVVVVASPNLNVVELVEDELLLALPNRVCTDDECAHKPSMYYGVDGKAVDKEAVAESDVEETRRFPFAGLKEAMNSGGEDKT